VSVIQDPSLLPLVVGLAWPKEKDRSLNFILYPPRVLPSPSTEGCFTLTSKASLA
jgi:hypothetical protein